MLDLRFEVVVPPLRHDVGGFEQNLSAWSGGRWIYLAAEPPTMIIWAEHDPLIPVAHVYAAHERIRGSRLEGACR